MFDKYFDRKVRRDFRRKICRTKKNALRFCKRIHVSLRRSYIRNFRIRKGPRDWLNEKKNAVPLTLLSFRAKVVCEWNGIRQDIAEIAAAGRDEFKAGTAALKHQVPGMLAFFGKKLQAAMHDKKIRRRTIEVAAPIVTAVLVVAFFTMTAPYGIAANGEKVKDPWAVKAGEKEIAIVKDQAAAKRVVAQVKAYYGTGDDNVKQVSITPSVKVESKDLEWGDDPVKVSSVDRAADTIIDANKSDDPVITVATTENVVSQKTIAYDTDVKKSGKYEEGTTKVATEGQNGTKEIVSQVIKKNGEVVDTQVLQETVTAAPVTKVVVKGTKVSRTGEKVVAYASQFLGNPYVWGGTSLTNGADCSGFTLSVYAHFGISLPHSAAAQRAYGKAVSYSQARPGDLFFYSHHVAIYIGGGRIIHASSPSTGIIYGNAHYRTIECIRRLL